MAPTELGGPGPRPCAGSLQAGAVAALPATKHKWPDLRPQGSSRTSCFLWDIAPSWWVFEMAMHNPGGGLPCQRIYFPNIPLPDHRPISRVGGLSCPGCLQGRCQGREVHACGYRCAFARAFVCAGVHRLTAPPHHDSQADPCLPLVPWGRRTIQSHQISR